MDEPVSAQHRAARIRAAIALAALAIAAGLAVHVGATLGRAPALDGDTFSRRPGDAAPSAGRSARMVRTVEYALQPVRRALRPGDRVALLVKGDDLGLLYACQYALAPAVVARARWSDCQVDAPEACAEGATYLLTGWASAEEATILAARAGFVVPMVVSPRGVRLLARGTP